MPSDKGKSIDQDNGSSNGDGAPASDSGRPYFHLLWHRELEELAPMLELIGERRQQILEHWHNQYTTHLGNTRALSEGEFREIFGQELDESLAVLLRRDLDGFVSNVRRVAERLVEREIPYFEVVISLHLFEESVVKSMPGFPALPPAYLAFDKLSHIRSIILADSYFRLRSSLLSTRIHELEDEAAQLPLAERRHFHGLVGASRLMRQLYERIASVARARGTIPIVGETGTGKELVARAIHEASGEPAGPFIAFNCAALPRELVESELFGYRRGAFSGATTEFLGLFRSAHGGTLFLDEITEMAPDTQSKLLRAVQERTVRPVGATQEIPVDLRLIASTNREPQEALQAGQIRKDLYYRLQANVLRVPPLRERLDDVPLLVEHFIDLFNQKLGRQPPIAGIEAPALEVMQRYTWPGNVRELANAIETSFTFGRHNRVRLEDLPPEIKAVSTVGGGRTVDSFAGAERELIRQALEKTNGNKVQAARLLGISRKKLYARIKQYGWR
jgi:DNA-binding NtrC family response regulator